ncbi:ABC transporter substrate-binding protein [Acetivibrio straminisolvens]|uniref:Extracellular solute-binding protein n=1 Tax=Acetivibrio straminisolvens JCM 21531 TaxID=1294263 RepID=W4V9Y8_9FIRM|nr:extracellular solute-binding protein [Acetivibrio straminisolvens]GAE90002.1 extracellular solute-binding protein [Acetivibrio straminisolvens JCM 21531]
MKISRHTLLVSFLCFLIILTGCNFEGKVKIPNEYSRVQAAEIEEPDEDVEIEFWTYNDGWRAPISHFESIHPKIKINHVKFDFDSIGSEYKKALAAGEGPDILFFDSAYYSQFTTGEYLEDLLKEPYYAGRYEKDFPKDIWESNKSIDGKRLLAMTFLTSPIVTYYRWDIMQENGFPSEPEEVAKFIEESENLMAISKKLKAKGQYIFQMPIDIINLAGSYSGIFDKNLNFVRNSDLFVKALDIAREIKNQDLAIGANIVEPRAKEAIENGELVMVLGVGSWGTNTIKSYAPEQAGKWRVTAPPLGLKAWYSDSKLAINAQSQNKKWAWLFVEYVATQQEGGENIDMISGYYPARRNLKVMLRENEYFGNQLIQPLIEDLAEEMVQYRQTPMDDRALEIFNAEIFKAIESNVDSEKAIKDISNKIEDELKKEREALLKRK